MLSSSSAKTVGVIASYDTATPLPDKSGMSKAAQAARVAHGWIDVLYHGESMASLGRTHAPCGRAGRVGIAERKTA